MTETVPRPDPRKETFLPSFCTIPMVFAVVITAELLAIVLTLGAVSSLDSFLTELSLLSLYIQWIALSGGGALCLTRPWLKTMNHAWAGTLAWLLLLLVTLIVALGTSILPDSIVDQADTFEFVLKSLGISAIVSALTLHYLYLQFLWRQQVQAESEARFQALQSRIRPHFLFNSMNTIASLTRSDPELAEEVVQDLSDLFRASLSDAGRMSTLEDELELARGYLRIESLRMGNHLNIVWDLEPLPEEAHMPTLVLQPLLENAVNHGIEPASNPGTIRITGRYRQNRVNLSILNTLPPHGHGSRRKGNRMALANIEQRLQGFFGEQGSLSIGQVDGKHQVRVVFPYPWKIP
ncbi:MAG: sensor histidine kinase [Gammaproteobacteria bacterium]|nr:sensor histidine kinase [Gammaproteobacteria bacterium]